MTWIAIVLGAISAYAIYLLLPEFQVQIQLQDEPKDKLAREESPQKPSRDSVEVVPDVVDRRDVHDSNRGGKEHQPDQEPRESSKQAERLSLEDLTELVEPSVVRIHAENSTGSGFLIDESGMIVTNRHVISAARGGTVEFHDGFKVNIVGVLMVDVGKDIAILKVDEISPHAQPIAMTEAFPRKGESVAGFGAPFGLAFSVSSGVVSGIRSEQELKELGIDKSGTWIQMTTPISRGNSGGPLVNMRGECVGINTFILRVGQNLNFALSATELREIAEIARHERPKPLIPKAPLDLVPILVDQGDKRDVIDISSTDETKPYLKELESFSIRTVPSEKGHESEKIWPDIAEKTQAELKSFEFKPIRNPEPNIPELILTFEYRPHPEEKELLLTTLKSSLLTTRRDARGEKELVCIWRHDEYLGPIKKNELSSGVILNPKRRRMIERHIESLAKKLHVTKVRLVDRKRPAGKLAEGKLRIAKQYFENDKESAGKEKLRELLLDYPDTPAAEEAKDLLIEMHSQNDENEAKRKLNAIETRMNREKTDVTRKQLERLILAYPKTKAGEQAQEMIDTLNTGDAETDPIDE